MGAALSLPSVSSCAGDLCALVALHGQPLPWAGFRGRSRKDKPPAGFTPFFKIWLELEKVPLPRQRSQIMGRGSPGGAPVALRPPVI